MRDIIVTLAVFGTLPFILKRPWIGILVWSWLSYMNPHRMAWGFSTSMPFAFMVALATFVGILFSREKKEIVWSRETWLMLALTAWMFLTTVFSWYPGLAWPQWDKVWRIMLMTYVTLMLIRDRDRVHWLVVVIAFSLAFYGVKGGKIDVHKVLVLSSICCAGCYLLVVFSRNPLISLIGCAFIGLFVGLMWPGVFSLSARVFPTGGTAMFAYLAFAGDVGCSLGPGLVGFISDRVIGGGGKIMASWFAGSTITETGLKAGLLIAIVFPAALTFGVLALWRKR